jgi:hypothetical protein
MANRDLLKEAIADAKTVKETAIANAKVALEEAFTPYLKEKLAAKLAEMDEADEAKEEMTEMKEKDMDENYDMEEAKHMNKKEMDEMDMDEMGMDEAKEMDEMDLDELLRELDELEEGDDSVDERLGTINDPTGDYEHGNLAEAEDAELEAGKMEDSDADGVPDDQDEEIDLENMSEDDLKSFIESVIADMVETGELEGGEGMESEEGEEGEEGEMEMGAEMMAEVKKMKKEVEEAKKAKEKAEKELKEALSTVSTIRTELQEVNLFNAKLLYTNKIFKAKTLTESQKVKILAAFDKAASVKEAKLVFETLSEGFVEKKAPMNESLLRGSASKVTGVAAKKPIMEANDQVARWQKLAGINIIK